MLKPRYAEFILSYQFGGYGDGKIKMQTDAMQNDNDKINALLAQEENLLNRAVAKTMEAYNQEPTNANLKDWESARDALMKCRGRKATEANPAQVALAGIPEVLEYLKAEGWKIEKSNW